MLVHLKMSLIHAPLRGVWLQIIDLGNFVSHLEPLVQLSCGITLATDYWDSSNSHPQVNNMFDTRFDIIPKYRQTEQSQSATVEGLWCSHDQLIAVSTFRVHVWVVNGWAVRRCCWCEKTYYEVVQYRQACSLRSWLVGDIPVRIYLSPEKEPWCQLPRTKHRRLEAGWMPFRQEHPFSWISR